MGATLEKTMHSRTSAGVLLGASAVMTCIGTVRLPYFSSTTWH